MINIEPLKDDDGDPITTALTGESIGVNFYAYNDNPNSSAIAKIRVFIERTTADSIKSPEVREEDRKELDIDGQVGGKATQIKGKWGKAKAENCSKENEDEELDYIEFELPSGASVALDLPVFVETGYDTSVGARVFSEYKVADRKGSYPDEWTQAMQETQLTWTGSFGWENFVKNVDSEKIGYSELIDGYFDPAELSYSFGATNKYLGKTTGIVYTKEMVIEDTLSLPSGLTIPAGYVVSEDKSKITNNKGDVIYEISAKHGKIDELKIDSNNKISYKATITNPDDKDTSWNPYADLNTTLHLDKIEVDESANLSDSSINNKATTTISSANDKVEKYSGSCPAVTEFSPATGLGIKKDIVSVKNASGQNVSKSAGTSGAEWRVGKDFVITYQLTVSNNGTSRMAVNDLTDILPAGLTVDEKSISVKTAGSSLTDFNKSVTTKSDGTTTVLLSGFSVPAAAKSLVTYTATVTDDDELFEDGKELTNTATLGSDNDTSTVKMAAEPDIRIKKEVVARFTKDINNSDIVIYGNYDWDNGRYNSIDIRGNVKGLGLYDQYPDMDTKNRLLHEFNAGDYIVYQIHVENEGSGSFEGYIEDRGALNDMYGSLWSKYYASGENFYRIYNGSNGTATGALSTSVYGVSTEKGTSSGSIFCGKTDFYDNCAASGGTNKLGAASAGWHWEFSEERAIAPGTSLDQTVILQLPGAANQEIKRTSQSSSFEDNYQFERLATAYSYYARSGSNIGKTLGNYAAAVESGSNKRVSSDNIYHTVKGQLSIHTGVISKGIAADRNNIKSSDLKTYYSGPDGWKNYDSSDLNTFEALDNQVIVNYVYVYNDSDQTLTFGSNKLKLDVLIPSEFEYMGMVSPNGTSGDNKGMHLSFSDVKSTTETKSSAYSAQIVAPNYRSGSPSIYSGATGYCQIAQVDNSYSINNTLQRQSSSTRNNSAGIYEEITVTDNNTKIAPYTGMAFYYAVRVRNADAARNRYKNTSAYEALFFARIYNDSGVYLPNYSPMVEVQEFFASPVRQSYRNGLDNPGDTSAWLHNATTDRTKPGSYIGYINSVYHNPSSMLAGVSLRLTESHRYRVSVDKNVVKNDGEDSTAQYRDGNTYKSGIELNGKYDDYEWNYPLHDGIHRTVDGTVTWKVNVANKGDDTAYEGVNYSMLADTVDSPYELAELYIPELIFNSTDMDKETVYQDFRAKLPIGSDGWTSVGSGVDVIAFDMSGNTIGTSFDSSYLSKPRIRVTRKLVSGGSIATGYDVTNGDKNVDAYRYIVEIAGTFEGGTLRYPLLAESESVDMYFTFATTDAIETNYNSFALVMPQLDANSSVECANNAKVTTVAGMHNGKGSVATASARRNAAKKAAPSNIANQTGPYYPSGPAYEYAQESSSAKAVEYSDWTDTSYTDGKKTVTLLDDEGNEVSSINTRSDGNMVLPGTAKAGDKMHVNLLVESVLFESENYTHFDDLVIYDLYGTSSKFSAAFQKNLVGYDVDFSTIKLSDSLGRTYQLGEDYDIYYTNANLVYTEHHPISPVNTLTFAADYSLLEADSTEWKLYKAGDEVSIDNAHAFKIVLKNGKDAVYNHRTTDKGSEWAGFKMYVDYDARVADDVKSFTLSSPYSYPNIEAYSAQMHVKDSTEIKPFIEDTTAALIQASPSSSIEISKKLTDINGGTDNVDEDAEFRFLVVRMKAGSSGIKADNVDAIMAFTLKGQKSVDLKKLGKESIIYSEQDSSGAALVNDANEFFTTTRQQQYYIIELDTGSCINTNVVANSAVSMNRSANNTATAFDLSTITTKDSSINKLLKENKDNKFRYLNFSKYNGSAQGGYSLSATFTNVYSTRDIEITKTNEDGNVIYKDTEFQIKDDHGNVVKFTKGDDGYTYSAEGTSETLTCNGIMTLKDLEPGEYTVAETKAPDGYTIDSETKGNVSISLTSVGAAKDKLYKLSISNPESDEEITADLVINKTDTDTKKLITEDTAKFSIYDSKDEDAEPLTFATKTDEDGKTYYEYSAVGSSLTETLTTDEGTSKVTGLKTGKYYLVETKTPDGYATTADSLENALEVDVVRYKTNTEISVENEWVSAAVEVIKIDAATKEPVKGSAANFIITDADDSKLTFEKTSAGKYKFSKEGSETELSSDPATGKLTVTSMPKGEYKLTEIEAPAGYTLNEDATAFVVENNDGVKVTVADNPETIGLRLIKKWRLEGGSKTYPLKGVPFTLYKTNSDNTKAEKVQEGVTGVKGNLDLGEIDWQTVYYLKEEVPEGYSASATDTVYLDEDGNIDLEASDGESAEVIKLDLKDKSDEFISDGDSLVYEANVLNIKNVTYGGMYASVSYKTIDNEPSYEKYGIAHERGYSYYYTEKDYDEGNFNYVHAVNNGDEVTYTLNVANVSDTEFANLVLIDRMPQPKDTGVVNLKENRDSEFTVNNSDKNIKVEVDGDEIPADRYSLSFSSKVKFTEGDFDGKTEWDADITEDQTRSFRIVFDDEFRLVPGQTVVVTYNGTIDSDAKIGQIAWNDFAYRYVAVDEEAEGSVKKVAANKTVNSAKTIVNKTITGVTITPEPPKVGVLIIDAAEGEIAISGKKTMNVGTLDDGSFTFSLYNKSDYDAYKKAVAEKSSKIPELKPVATAATEGSKISEDKKTAEFEFKDKLKYTLADLVDEDGNRVEYKTFEYVAVEDIPETADENGYDAAADILYDKTEIPVNVKVTNTNTKDLKVELMTKEDAVTFTNSKAYTKLSLTKSIDKFIGGDTVGEYVNATLEFKLTYDDPVTGEKGVNRSVFVKFDKDDPTTKTVTVDKIPIDATVTVKEVYSSNYKPADPVTVTAAEDENGYPVFKVTLNNTQVKAINGSGIINNVKPSKDGKYEWEVKEVDDSGSDAEDNSPR